MEVLYRRGRWRECCEFLNKVKAGHIKAYVPRFTIHGISAILGKPDLVARFLSEVMTWRDLAIIDLPLEEEIVAAELAAKVNLDFDDCLHYYYAKRMGLKIVSFDRDFDKTGIERLEPKDVKTT
ncbi:PIN domain-containing protein [Vulcanisaeta sp. JCM 16161]|uniref:type II toxin-antitoxin system VapC family toxin n=1 Tax=Vulcanisaeta sp. JCM 16161 TaxID=1295372 RepID=UPI001FB412FB|nr:PIN domain-containing protein [Vulcanisaeta sp. JCM 16161]